VAALIPPSLARSAEPLYQEIRAVLESAYAALNYLTGLAEVICCGQALGQDQTAQGREGIVRLPGTTVFQSDSGHERCCGADRRLVGRFDIHHLSLQGVHGQMGSHEGGEARRQRQHLPVPLHCPADPRGGGHRIRGQQDSESRS